MSRALKEQDSDCWINGRRRDHGAERAALPVWEARKLNPLAFWSFEDCWAYLRKNLVPYHPLHDAGFSSLDRGNRSSMIVCAYCMICMASMLLYCLYDMLAKHHVRSIISLFSYCCVCPYILIPYTYIHTGDMHSTKKVEAKVWFAYGGERLGRFQNLVNRVRYGCICLCMGVRMWICACR